MFKCIDHHISTTTFCDQYPAHVLNFSLMLELRPFEKYKLLHICIPSIYRRCYPLQNDIRIPALMWILSGASIK
jgi:hypothetical protein